MRRTLLGLSFGLLCSAPLMAQDIQLGWHEHPSLRAGKWLRVDFRARFQGDIRRSEAETVDADEGFDVARRRIGIEGRLMRIFDYEVDYEMAAGEWRDVYLNYRRSKALQVRAGQFKVPFSLDENTSPTNLDFVYRSRISARLAPGRDRGVTAHGSLFREVVSYEAGAFAHDGDNAQPSRSTRVAGGPTAAVRVVVKPFRRSKSMLADLQAGLAVSHSTVSEGYPAVRARTVFGDSFFESDVVVNGGRQRTGLEVRWRPGPFSIQGEYIRLTDERRGESVEDGDLPPLIADGWYLSGTYALTGDRKAAGLGAPKHPFLPFSKSGGAGAIEVAARFETIVFGQLGPAADLSTSRRAEHVLGNADRALTFGANWYLNRWVKLQVNVIREWIHDPSMGPLPGQASFWSQVFRLQFTL